MFQICCLGKIKTSLFPLWALVSTHDKKSLILALVVNASSSLFLLSPVKFSGGDCWARSPLLRGGGPGILQSPQDQTMEPSTPEQMDVTTSSEASAPLPIRQPTGVNLAQVKQQAYPVAAKRPEHLRMNLWPAAPLEERLILDFFFLLFISFKKQSKKKKLVARDN